MDDELRKANVISMVPAAPLLPTSDPLRAEVGHWAGPVDEVDDVDEVEEVVVAGGEVVVDDDADGRVVVGVDEGPDEHPASTDPSATSRAAAIGSRGRKCPTKMASG